jgi:site-specific DNA recombinase
MNKERKRCAIYTRKSNVEGLEQSFNSLEAQREGCQAFIVSQKQEGWHLLPDHYDDGGFSGGNMERPGLQQLLCDVKEGKVDVIVVYKIDRLTRSLGDFAKMIEILDSHAVSFVSVTQQFNTTTSMGRLTLHVLLSFAQFEREVTGERIRDKIAASKQKGMWMGGSLALGYDCVGRKLVVKVEEAKLLRHIFRSYLRLGCVSKLKEFLDRKQIRSKSRRNIGGQKQSGAPFSRGALYHLLGNRLYLGEIVHRGRSYHGQHRPIVPRELWRRVASRLRSNDQAHGRGSSQGTPSLLVGKLFDSSGIRLTPTHAIKNAKRYRYYTSQAVVQKTNVRPAITRLPAAELEQLVTSEIYQLLLGPDKSLVGANDRAVRAAATQRAKDLAVEWPQLGGSRQHEFIAKVVRRVEVSPTTLSIEIDKSNFARELLGRRSGTPLRFFKEDSQSFKITAAFKAIRVRGEVRIVDSDGGIKLRPLPSLVKAVARARDWYVRIVAGEFESVDDLARTHGLTRRYVRKILQCANLSPRIVEAILAGKQRSSLTLKEILQSKSLIWREQERSLLSDTAEVS